MKCIPESSRQNIFTCSDLCSIIHDILIILVPRPIAIADYSTEHYMHASCPLTHTFMTLFPTCPQQILHSTRSGGSIVLQHYTLFSLLNAISPKVSNAIKCTLCTFCCLKMSPITEAAKIIPSFIFHTTEYCNKP